MVLFIAQFVRFFSLRIVQQLVKRRLRKFVDGFLTILINLILLL